LGRKNLRRTVSVGKWKFWETEVELSFKWQRTEFMFTNVM